MARVYKSKGIQTKKELSGEQNMSSDYIESHKDEADNLMTTLIGVFDVGLKQRKRGTNWTEEELTESISKYFQFCSDKNMKPSKSSLGLWLGCSRAQYYSWQSENAKYGAISDIINMANAVMENEYINRGEKNPTFNIFMLKAGHGMVETNKVEISNTTNANPDEIKDVINKLGLDNKE